MKRVLIYLLCLVLFLQSGLVTYAEETCAVTNEVLNQLTLENESERQKDQIEESESKTDSEAEESKTDSEAEESKTDSEAEESKTDSEAEESKTDSEAEESKTDSEAEESKTDSEAEESKTDSEAEKSENDSEVEETESEIDSEVEKTESKVDSEVEEEIEEQTEVTDDITEEKQVIEEITGDDPQFGRENGYIDEKFYGISSFGTNANGYIHNEKFDDCVVETVIDVSKYQGDIDWKTVKKSGIDYAIIRVGFRGYGETGTLNTDSHFDNNIEQAIAAGVKVGVYFFSQAINVEEAVEEANYVLDLIEEYKLSLPVVIDYEYASTIDGLTGRLYNANLSKDDATGICKIFCKVIKDNGYQPMVYANKDMLENGLHASAIAQEYDIWLANYGNVSSYEGDYRFWQYTQEGTVSGISGKVDKSFWYKETEAVYNGVDYSSVYNFKFYIEKYPDLKKAFGNDQKAAISHFVNYGMKEGRYGNDEFNVYTYRNRYADLRATYRKNWKSYYMHYVNYGQKEGRDGSGSSELFKPVTQYKGIEYSAVYDYNYYLENNITVNEQFNGDDVGALEYFVNYGMKECHQAKEEFNPMTYRNRYTDLRKLYGNDWIKYYSHYMKYGKKEGRDASGTAPYVSLVTSYKGVDYSAVYDYTYYTEKYQDIKKAYGNNENAVIAHFVNYGMKEGRQGNESFNVKTYRNRYVDLRKSFGKDWTKYYSHYINYGKKEGRSGSGISELKNPVTVYNGVDYSRVYNFNYYIEKYFDLKKIYGDDDVEALKHFVNYGMSEGRQGIANFNVYVYKSNNRDLTNVYGNNLKSYYMHYLNYGYNEGRQATDIGRISSCKIMNVDNETVTLQVKLELYEASSKYDTYYIVAVDSYMGVTVEEIIASRDTGESIEVVNITVTNEKAKALLQGELALTVKNTSGKMLISSPCVPFSNPEALATNTVAIYQGTSKKGLQGITYASYDGGSDIVDARNANTKHTLLNLDIASIVSTTQKSGFIAYPYKGKTYYFSNLSDLKANISSLNTGYKQYLNGNSGTTPVAVSLCLLLGYNAENSYLIDPAARASGHSYYLMNVREEKGRETLEALFLYLGETFGQENCYVSNWILGNEINSSKAWNYSGSLDFNTYMDCYTTAFRLLYNGVKSTKTGNTVCISLDNGWTAAPDTYAGKTTLDAFAKRIHQMNPNIDWSIAYHAYSYPLTRADFWNDYSNTTDNLSTKYISMRNIKVLTNYAGTLEKTYGKTHGTIRVLLTEQGYSYGAGAEVQAQAIARGYYIAQFNDRIDAFIIRAVMDDKDETQGRLYFGLMNRLSEKRIAFYVYEYMDSDIDKFSKVSASGTVSSANYSKFNKAKEIVCNTNWSSIVPGFDKAKLATIK